jgi:molecular chaperone DnaK (HSP70)
MKPFEALRDKLRERGSTGDARRVIGIDLGTTNSTVAQLRI